MHKEVASILAETSKIAEQVTAMATVCCKTDGTVACFTHGGLGEIALASHVIHAYVHQTLGLTVSKVKLDEISNVVEIKK